MTPMRERYYFQEASSQFGEGEALKVSMFDCMFHRVYEGCFHPHRMQPTVCESLVFTVGVVLVVYFHKQVRERFDAVPVECKATIAAGVGEASTCGRNASLMPDRLGTCELPISSSDDGRKCGTS